MTLPLLLSVPHAGLEIAPEVEGYCTLSPDDVLHDSDEGAGEIYNLASEVKHFVTTPIARAIVDMNRSVDDRGPDGVVKTHTCWNVPVYGEPLSEKMVQQLLQRYYHPYHAQLAERSGEVLYGIDCHTMAAEGPLVGPDPGKVRPYICLGNAEGTCSQDQLDHWTGCFEEVFGFPVSRNDPFRGGYIVRSHAQELPWIQMEFSRADFLSLTEKREKLLAVLHLFCRNR